jgi:hypothetical protein
MNYIRTCCAGLVLSQVGYFAPAQPVPGTQLWVFDTGQTIYSAPALAPDGTLYVGSGWAVYAITNAGSTVSNKWIFSGVGSALGSPAVGHDGTIYATAGDFYAINRDGTQQWTYHIGASKGAPAIGPNKEIYVHGFHLLYALSSDGTLMWTNRIGGDPGASAPVIAPTGTIYIPSPDVGMLYAIDSDGALKWQSPLGSGGTSAALGGDGTLYASGVWTFYALNSSGASLWGYTTNGFMGDSAAVGKDGTIYFTGWESDSPLGYLVVLRAVSPSGVLKWQFKPAPWGQVYTPPGPAIDSAGTVYCSAFNTLYAISPDGQQKWTFNAGGSVMDQRTYSYTSPAIGPAGTIYVTFGSRLYAIASGTNGPADSPWPMYRQNARRTGKVEKPALQKPQKRADANFQFQLYPQQLGLTYTIDSSTNLNTWTSMTSFVATTFPTDVVDLTATNAPFRFYRASSPQ